MKLGLCLKMCIKVNSKWKYFTHKKTKMDAA